MTMNFKIRPKLHLVTYYRLLPLIALALVLGLFSYFGFSQSFFYAIFFYIVLISIIIAVMCLFEPLFSEVSVEESKISYLTFAGGEIVIDLDDLNPNKCILNSVGLFIEDNLENQLIISNRLFAPADIQKVIAHIENDS